MKALLVIDMSDEEYRLFKKYAKQEMIVDIGYDYDNISGWAFIRRKLLRVKPMPTQVIGYRNTFAIENKYMNYQDGYNACIDDILGDNNE